MWNLMAEVFVHTALTWGRMEADAWSLSGHLVSLPVFSEFVMVFRPIFKRFDMF